VEIYYGLAYRLEPLTEKGILAVDGERVGDYGPIQGVVLPQTMQVIGSISTMREEEMKEEQEGRE